MNFAIFDQFLEYMRLGGSIMWIILALSVLSAAVVIERLFFFALSSGNLNKLQGVFDRSVIKPLSDSSDASRFHVGKSSLHRLFSVAWDHWEDDDAQLDSKLEEAIRRELYEWERNLPMLEIIARVAPLLGLLGTVLGMVEMFGAMSMGGAVNARVVTGGIWKALFTTVAGLSVAIPVLLAHGFLTGAIEREEETLERGASFILDKRRETQKAKPKAKGDSL
jgi:biopolymer transport protein ExbB